MERPEEQGEQSLLFGVAFIIETEKEIVKIVFDQKTAEDTIPDREQASVIGIVLASKPGVMQTVHQG